MAKHKLGIIGYGNMGAWHAKNIRERIEGLCVSIIYDINERRRDKAREDGFLVCETVEEIFESDVDIVVIATPNNFHKDYSVRALLGGKNVVCEKPVCLNMDELDEIFYAAGKSGKLFTAHYNRRWDYDYNIVKKILKDDMIGKPYRIYSRLCSNRNIPSDWRTQKIAGGGYLYDWGAHIIDQALMLFDTLPVSVFADLKHLYQEQVDDSFSVVLKWANGLTMHLLADSWTFIKEARWHLTGLDGTAIVNNWNSNNEGKIIRTTVKEISWEDGCVYTENGLSRTMWPRPKNETLELPLPEIEVPKWKEFYMNVMDCIEGKAEPLITQTHIRNVQVILDACFKSAEKNEVIPLSF